MLKSDWMRHVVNQKQFLKTLCDRSEENDLKMTDRDGTHFVYIFKFEFRSI